MCNCSHNRACSWYVGNNFLVLVHVQSVRNSPNQRDNEKCTEPELMSNITDRSGLLRLRINAELRQQELALQFFFIQVFTSKVFRTWFFLFRVTWSLPQDSCTPSHYQYRRSGPKQFSSQQCSSAGVGAEWFTRDHSKLVSAEFFHVRCQDATEGWMLVGPGLLWKSDSMSKLLSQGLNLVRWCPQNVQEWEWGVVGQKFWKIELPMDINLKSTGILQLKVVVLIRE